MKNHEIMNPSQKYTAPPSLAMYKLEREREKEKEHGETIKAPPPAAGA